MTGKTNFPASPELFFTIIFTAFCLFQLYLKHYHRVKRGSYWNDNTWPPDAEVWKQSDYLPVLQESSLLGMHSMSRRRTLGKHLENGRMSMVCPFAILLFRFFSWPETLWLGDIIHLSAFGQHTIILNSVEAACDLLEKRSSVYSDRNEFPMLFDLWVNSLRATGSYSTMLNLLRMGNDWNFVLMRYGDWWRMHRKIFHQEFNSGVVSAFYEVQLKYTRWALPLFIRCSTYVTYTL